MLFTKYTYLEGKKKNDFFFKQIVYNVPHRFDYMLMHNSMFSKQMAQFNVKWDGPITEIILSDTLATTKSDSSGYDPVFEGVTLLQHVDIDNEVIE